MGNFINIMANGKKLVTILLILTPILFFDSVAPVLAHGGEDHGDQQPKATSSGKGTVTRSARLGEYELTFKQPLLEPDTAVAAKLFVTKFETNEAVENAAAQVEIESVANNSVTEATVEKTDAAGSYSVKIPALPQGVYTIRAKLTYKGETDTATFSGIEVAPAPMAAESAASRARTALIGFVLTLVLALFGGLIYFVWNYAGAADENGERAAVSGETVSI